MALPFGLFSIIDTDFNPLTLPACCDDIDKETSRVRDHLASPKCRHGARPVAMGG